MSKIQILFGTESGNAERMAILCNVLAKAMDYEPELMDMSKFEPAQMKDWSTMIMVISTNGDGEMPYNAETAWEEAQESQIEGLENLKYGILALGDTAYDYFCQAGIDWDNYLKKAEAESVIARADLDIDFYEPGTQWIINWFAAFSGKPTEDVKNTLEQALANDDSVDAASENTYSQNNPWQAEVSVKRNLCGEGSSKTVNHYELDLSGSNIAYKPGDCFEVLPVNDASLVDALIDTMNWSPKDLVDINGKKKNIRDALINDLEIRTPSNKMLDLISRRGADQRLRDVLAEADKESLEKFVYGHDVLSLVNEYSKPPAAKTGLKAHLQSLLGKTPYYPRFDMGIFVQYLKPLQPRAYSIASSQSAHNDSVHLTIAEVAYVKDGRQHQGVCSNYISGIGDKKQKVACWLLPNKYFRLPEDDNTPVIMIGPGTGIAPFVGFLQEREQRGAKGDNWLFFGDRQSSTDFLYQEELKGFEKSGLLTRMDTAFSRDQEHKIYVQHKIAEAADDFFQWLERGAYIYVCGDASAMAHDVEQAILSVVEKAGNKTPEEAAAYVKSLHREQRYLKDVY